MMSSFKKFQKEFCQFIQSSGEETEVPMCFDGVGSLSRKKVLKVYKEDFYARLTEALGSTYEVTWEVLGDTDFLKACELYISRNPSHFYSLGDYGEGFPALLESLGVNEQIPFASELANFEWRFWKVFHAGFSNKKRMSLESLNANILEDKPLYFAPEVSLGSSEYRVAKLWQNRSDLSQMNVEDFYGEEFFILRRSSLGVRLNVLSEEEYLFLSSIFKNQRWSKSTAELEFLQNWSQTQWADFFGLTVHFLMYESASE